MKIDRVFVVGGGTMGRGIASLSALSGYTTGVFEADSAARSRLKEAIEGSWERAAEKGKVRREAIAAARARLVVAEALDGAADADLVVEAIPESLALKKQVFADLARLCGPEAVLGSNTSSLSISEIARAAGKPERVVGIHFFNPVAAMPLVEIVRGRETSRAADEAAADFAASLGKTPIRVADTPGFATSRLGVALGLEAMRMLEEGVAGVEDIDRAMELGYGHRMGPLKTSDLVGLDVRLAIAETLSRELSDGRFSPPALLSRLVEKGKTGKKSGEGFYRWNGDTASAVDFTEEP